MEHATAVTTVVLFAFLSAPFALAEEPSEAMRATNAWIAQVELFNKAAEEFNGQCDPITEALLDLIPLQRRMQAMALRGQSLTAEEKQALGPQVQALTERFTQNLYVVGTACGKDSEFSKVLKQM